MPGCCVPHCSNHARNGWKLYRFPAQPNRRLLWIAQVKRANWEPTPTSYVCSAHFVESSFEQHRADGWRKLKPNAVPTVFPSKPSPKQRKPPKKKTKPSVSSMACQGEALPTHEGGAVTTTTGSSPVTSGKTTLVLLPSSSEEVPPEQDGSPRTFLPRTFLLSNPPEDGNHSESSSASLLCIEMTSVLDSSQVPSEQDSRPGSSSASNPLEDGNYSECASPVPLCNGARDLQSATCSCAELSKQLADLTEKFNQLHDSHRKANTTIESLVKKVRKLENDVGSMKKRLKILEGDQVESRSRRVAKGTPGRHKQSGKQCRINSRVQRQATKQ